MSTYLMSSAIAGRIFEFACSLAEASRIFTLQQVARHPDLCWRSQPVKRASEVLRPYADSFDKMVGPAGEPFRWRLSAKERRQRGIKQTPIHGVSQRADHWLGIGDIWSSLTFFSGRPETWKTEPDRQFDVYCVWQGKPYLIEFQRTSITSKQWKAKWTKRVEWYKAQTWDVRPRVVLVDLTGQQEDTIGLPKGTVHVRQIDTLPTVLGRRT